MTSSLCSGMLAPAECVSCLSMHACTAFHVLQMQQLLRGSTCVFILVVGRGSF